jgi:hypothetical protein
LVVSKPHFRHAKQSCESKLTDDCKWRPCAEKQSKKIGPFGVDDSGGLGDKTTSCQQEVQANKTKDQEDKTSYKEKCCYPS